MAQGDIEVIFTQRAFNSIVTETIHKHPIETGGVLLGYVLDTGVWIVVENIPPGYLARHQWAEFAYDEEFSEYLANVVNRQYKANLQLLGLWHRHPSSMDTFSTVDDGTNLKYARLSRLGAISGLVNCDPQMRLTMYHVNGKGEYTRIPWMVDDGTLLPESFTELRYPTEATLPFFDQRGVVEPPAKAAAATPAPEAAAPPLAPATAPWKGVERREERALVPTTLRDSARDMAAGTALPLRGYYVESTHIYNIFSPDVEADLARVQTLGYVFPERVLARLGEDVEARVKTLEPAPTAEKQPLMQRLRDVLSRRRDTPLRSFTLASLQAALGELYSLAPELWWHQEFLPALNGREGAHALLGERREDGSCRLVHVGSMVEVRQESYSLQLDVFSRNTGILESGIMLDKGAILIGCGSVGSLVAVELAKAGVGRFLLVDNDIFAYHNICRHQCGIYDVGRRKADALAERILQINPHARVIRQHCLIQDVDTDLLADFCRQDAIFVGGADNFGGNLYACERAKEYKAAFISVGCWERACAGNIFYWYEPEQPDYADFLAAMNYQGEEVMQNRQFYTTEEDLAKVSFEPGISADINFVTIVAVKLIIDILNRHTEGHRPRLLPYLSHLTLVCNTHDTAIAGEDVAIFEYPLQVTTSVYVPHRAQAQVKAAAEAAAPEEPAPAEAPSASAAEAGESQPENANRAE